MQQIFRITRNLKLHVHRSYDAYDPSKHPHAPKGAPAGKGGQFVSKGSGGGGSTSPEPEKQTKPESKPAPKSEHHPDLINVGGDEWNKSTAKRLADEFRDSKPELDNVKQKILDSGPLAEPEEKQDWQQDAAKNEKWYKLDGETKKEVGNDWMESHWNEMNKENEQYLEEHPGEFLYKTTSKDQMEELTLKTLKTVWENMEMHEKYEYAATHHPKVIKMEEGQRKKNLGEPTKYDPLNDPLDDLSGEEYEEGLQNYKKTQALARKMSIDRGYDLILQRKAKDTEGWGEQSFSDLRDDIQRTDETLWKDWKSSSTSQDGYLIQAAAADELGGRARGLDINTWKDYANTNYGSVGGWDGIKAMMRAKWETSQYLLEKAGINKVQVYRGLDYEAADGSQRMRVKTDYSGPVVTRETVPGYKEYNLLPDVTITRNGAASTSLAWDVSNKWDGDEHRVVLRISAPRTAVLSLPAYGMNETSEREVVLAGTAWNAWDAWSGTAAPIEAVPIGEAKGDPVDPPILHFFRNNLIDKGFTISRELHSKISGTYLNNEDKAYMTFEWSPITQSGKLMVQPDMYKEDSEETEVKGTPSNMLEAIDQAFGEIHGERMPHKIIDTTLAKAGYGEPDSVGGVLNTYPKSDDDTKVVVSKRVLADGTKKGGGTVWWHYNRYDETIEKGNNINDLWKHLGISPEQKQEQEQVKEAA